MNNPVPGAPWVIWHKDQNQDGRGYTITDVNAMRWQGQQIASVRLWTRTPGGGLQMLEGEIGKWSISQTRYDITVLLELFSIRRVTLEPDAIFEIVADAGRPGPLPVGTIPDGMIALEGRTSSGFTPVSCMDHNNIEIDYSSIRVLSWDGQAMSFQERCEVTLKSVCDALVGFLRGP